MELIQLMTYKGFACVTRGASANLYDVNEQVIVATAVFDLYANNALASRYDFSCSALNSILKKSNKVIKKPRISFSMCFFKGVDY
ncbi:hypothetical protein EB796_015436 [Bugula neritina]|uniref:Uncharacterized protein n=1 Tax=Bugula neritina TaxID=10212 RepID=A0A7J7JIZ9_BUGNE|nr:hypothetical protein EB796_015436 [Bugula neritina]